MNCFNHPEIPAISFCRSCGKPMCAACQRPAEGTVYCADHLPGSAQGAYGPRPGSDPNPYAPGQSSAVPPVGGSFVQGNPALAFILGWIPGVGAIYNGQYLKGIVHAGIFGLLASLIASMEDHALQPFLGFMLAAFIFYMPFEAYHTAKKRQLGIYQEEWSSFGRGALPGAGRTPVGAIVLIGLGVLFLLDTMNLIEFRQIGRFWPVLLIAVGAYMLYARVSPASATAPPYPSPASPPPPGPGSSSSQPLTADGTEFRRD